jgi:hypothetical protein
LTIAEISPHAFTPSFGEPYGWPGRRMRMGEFASAMGASQALGGK